MSLPKLFRARINLRLDDKVHAKLLAQAKKRKVSISEHLRDVLAKVAKAA